MNDLTVRTARTALAAAALCLGLSARVVADTNVAPLGIATQSTTDFGGFPERANDGNTDGDFGAGSTSHTMGGDPAPFWQVDLDKEYPISRIVVWNRTDCCGQRLTNFHISILDSSASEVEGDDFFTDLSFPDPSFEWTIDPPVNGLTVRIDRLGADTGGELFLSMAEVQVFTDAQGIAPTITRRPLNAIAFVGGSLDLTVEANGSDPLSYSWKKDGQVLNGKTSSTLTLNPLTAGDDGSYVAVVTNNDGTAESDPPTVVRVFAGHDLTHDGEASQSSTGYGGTPERAIDGNTEGNFNGNSVTHTNDGDLTPTWEVLLYGPSTVDGIFIWGRTDCCMNRLSNFKVSVLDIDRNESWSDSFFTDGTYPDTSVDPFEVPVPPGTPGQIVSIQLLGDLNAAGLYLSLAEVRVLGDGPKPPPSPNLALRDEASATQSSEFNGGQFPAGLAIDGSKTTFTHTGAGVNLPGTWEVNLGAENDIEEIVLWNRGDCCGSRLRDITVSILNLAGDATLFASDLLNPENELGVYPDGPEKLTINLFELTGGFVKGGRVRVVREPDPDLSGSGGLGNVEEADVLSLAEVEVWTPVDCPATGDTHCLPLFFKVEGPGPGLPGPYMVMARGNDDSGDPVRFTFTADNGKDPPKVAGPQANTETQFFLGIGHWTISATVDDNLRCDDVAANATCSTTVDIEGKANNQAPFGVATQSTTGYGGDPGRANDGITDGDFGANSVSHTADNDPTPWWEVELAETFALDRIVIFSRTDCCPNRFNNARLSVLSEDRTEIYSEDLFTDGFEYLDPFIYPDGYEVFLPQGTDGKIVRIELLGDLLGAGFYLSLAEVEIYSLPSGSEICTNGTDDDGDTKIDCADEDCAGRPACAGGTFHRGDADENGQLQLTDAIRILGVLFLGQGTIPCMDAADADDNGSLQLTDAIRILGVLFLGQGTIPAPGPTSEPCGADPTPDAGGSDLGCVSYTHCGA